MLCLIQICVFNVVSQIFFQVLCFNDNYTLTVDSRRRRVLGPLSVKRLGVLSENVLEERYFSGGLWLYVLVQFTVMCFSNLCYERNDRSMRIV